MNSIDKDLTRRDRIVIMARGRGTRMGASKGLMRLSRPGPVFVRIIADLYLEEGFPVDVVTREETAHAHRRELPVVDGLRVLPAADGGDTVLTLLTAWRSCLDAGIGGTHFWAHPVDLPLVSVATVSLLRESSCRNPHRVIRPEWQGTPGHPVILPREVLEVLDSQVRWHDGPLRQFLAGARSESLLPDPMTLEIGDQGCVRDFDRPEDFNDNRSS